MVRKNPKTPKRDFTLKYKGKKVNIVAATHSADIGDMWGAQFLCPWGCGSKFVANFKVTPKRVQEKLQLELENHWKVRHQNEKP